jgi:hypothetical protein
MPHGVPCTGACQDASMAAHSFCMLQIVSTQLVSKGTGYSYFPGSAPATAAVAGCVALLKQGNPRESVHRMLGLCSNAVQTAQLALKVILLWCSHLPRDIRMLQLFICAGSRANLFTTYLLDCTWCCRHHVRRDKASPAEHRCPAEGRVWSPSTRQPGVCQPAGPGECRVSCRQL